MPIGNLTSQMFANLYLNEADQFVKQELREHFYMRYMDDMLILGDDKKHLQTVKEQVERFLNAELKLNLNGKTSIRPIRCGIEFVGFRVWSTHIKLRKKTAKKMKETAENIRQKAKARLEMDSTAVRRGKCHPRPDTPKSDELHGRYSAFQQL